MELINDLKWRYATKKFSDKKVSADDINKIVEAINLSASSIGMQTYRLIVIDNAELKQRLGEGSFNSQIAEASHLLVFAAFDSVSSRNIDDYINLIAAQRNTTVDQLQDFKNSISGFLLGRSDEENFNWSARQAYIGLGTGLIAAAQLKVDATPMEGFDAEKFDLLLGLKEKNLRSVVLLALGYRDDEKDVLAKAEKVRLPVAEFATVVSL